MFETERGRRELSFGIGKQIHEVDWDRFNRQLDAIRGHDVGVVTYRDPHFPAYLRDIAKSPPILFYKGDLRLLARRGVAIVGSRNATTRGCRFAETLAADLAAMDVMVVSGLARGIDTAAHRGALANGGATVAVVGTGLDVIYPSQNAALMDAIGRDGCVLSEQLMGMSPLSFVFPLRNRLISAMSRIVVVVEAAARSGALLTATWALEQGREVGAVPGFPGDTRSCGANALLKKGAFPIESASDVLEAAPLLQLEDGAIPRGPSPLAQAPSLTGEAVEVFDALSASATDTDALATHLEKPVSTVQHILLDLEMQGLIARDRTGGYHKL
jgi:DNA processing protein